MRKLMRNVKLVAAASAVLAFMVAAPVVYGGLRWTGFDPELQVGGHKAGRTAARFRSTAKGDRVGRAALRDLGVGVAGLRSLEWRLTGLVGLVSG